MTQSVSQAAAPVSSGTETLEPEEATFVPDRGVPDLSTRDFFVTVSTAAAAGRNPIDPATCTAKGVRLFGKVRIVNSYPDIKVRVVSSYPDLKVQNVSSYPKKCGQWQFVTSGEDFKVQFVESYPDIAIQLVDSYPGVP